VILKPHLHGICQINGLSAQVNPRKAAGAFEVLDHVMIVLGGADMRYPEEADEFFFCHDGGERGNPAILARQER
jgi:hypothetical protein